MTPSIAPMKTLYVGLGVAGMRWIEDRVPKNVQALLKVPCGFLHNKSRRNIFLMAAVLCSSFP